MPKRRSSRLAQKMKRSKGEVKGRGMEKQERSLSRIDEESPEPSTSLVNPFLAETILRKLLKKVDTVTQLKDLRKMCVYWNKMGTEELEERAFKGKLKVIDFHWVVRFKSKEEAEKELVEFLEDTRSNPQLFRSFKFGVPESLNVLQDQMTFFSNYAISRVELYTIDEFESIFEEVQAQLKYFLNMVRSNLKEIQIPWTCHGKSAHFEPKSPNWPDQELVLPKLKKLIIVHRGWGIEFTEFFKSALVKDTGSGHITSLKLAALPGGDIGSFPSLDPARMTRLEVEIREGWDIALKFSEGLMNLAKRGLKLLDLGIRINSPRSTNTPDSLAQYLPRICSNLTQFLKTQSQTLLTLNLNLNISDIWPLTRKEIKAEIAKYGKIQLPIFQALHTLSLSHDMKIKNQNGHSKSIEFSLFDFTLSPPLHFPSLVNVTFASESSMNVLCDHPELIELPQASKYHFKRLMLPVVPVYDYPSKSNLGHWNSQYAALIGSVEYLEVRAKLLQEVNIPWGDSLRELRIRGVTAPLKLAHLTKLETLVIQGVQRFVPLYGKNRKHSHFYDDSENDTDSDLEFDFPRKSVREYLRWFREAKQLNLTYIQFNELWLEKGIMKDLFRYFPFPVQFEYCQHGGA